MKNSFGITFETSNWGKHNQIRGRATRKEMDPSKFLKIAPPIYEGHRWRMKGYVRKLKSDIMRSKKVQVPYLEYRGKRLVEHEGRHRSFILKSLGFKKMPVDIIQLGGKR